MLNSTLFGGGDARAALAKGQFDPEMPWIDTDWCVGGCKSWKETQAGRDRFAMLQGLFTEWGKEHPQKYEEFFAQMKSQK